MKHAILGTNVLVRQEEATKQSEGGILLPDGSQTKPKKGTVVKIGVGVVTKDFPVKVGDGVLFDRFAGAPVILDEAQYLIMDKDDLLVVLSG